MEIANILVLLEKFFTVIKEVSGLQEHLLLAPRVNISWLDLVPLDFQVQEPE
jgi:hypothetical protein